MIEPFEKALKEIYVPALIPGVRDVKIYPTNDGILLNKNIKTYPHSLIVKPSTPYDVNRKFTDTDDEGHTIMCIPFIANYELHTYVKHQRTAVDILQHITLYYRRSPYVVFNYRGVADFRIGLWQTGITQQQVSSEYTDAGGLVDVVWQFHANLVLTSLIEAPVIETVEISTSNLGGKVTITDD